MAAITDLGICRANHDVSVRLAHSRDGCMSQPGEDEIKALPKQVGIDLRIVSYTFDGLHFLHIPNPNRS